MPHDTIPLIYKTLKEKFVKIFSSRVQIIKSSLLNYILEFTARSIAYFVQILKAILLLSAACNHVVLILLYHRNIISIQILVSILTIVKTI